MSLFALVGDQFYLQGLKYNDIKYFKLAKKIFPFERAILQGDAEYYVKFGVIDLKAYEAIKEAYYYDPYIPRLLSYQMQYAFLMDDDNLGVQSFHKLKVMAPNMPLVKELIKRGAK